MTFDLNVIKSKFGHFCAPEKDTKVAYLFFWGVRNFIGDMILKVRGQGREPKIKARSVNACVDIFLVRLFKLA